LTLNNVPLALCLVRHIPLFIAHLGGLSYISANWYKPHLGGQGSVVKRFVISLSEQGLALL
tara:strand:+ start:62 stop:244 length:183 start_codon:yes stop_codon:yes gene_type:complete